MSLPQVTPRLKKKPFNVSHKVKFSLKKIFWSGGNSENIINISFYNCKILQNIKKWLEPGILLRSLKHS